MSTQISCCIAHHRGRFEQKPNAGNNSIWYPLVTHLYAKHLKFERNPICWILKSENKYWQDISIVNCRNVSQPRIIKLQYCNIHSVLSSNLTRWGRIIWIEFKKVSCSQNNFQRVWPHELAGSEAIESWFIFLRCPFIRSCNESITLDGDVGHGLEIRMRWNC